MSNNILNIEKIISINYILSTIEEEYKRALKSYGEFNSLHEGYAILKEEVEELWEEIKLSGRNSNISNTKNLILEATQVGAMAVGIINYIFKKQRGEI